MNLQQGIQSRAAANGFNRRRFDREGGTRTESKINPGKSGSSSFLNTGVVLRMAQMIKDGSRGVKGTAEAPKRPQTMIIPAREFVQIIAKDVPLTTDEFLGVNGHDKRKDLMIDSVISRSHNIEVERELERWTPDADTPECPELDNIFDGTWNRNWDQFETNATLFGVKSTFNEELYTTKLERGPQTKDLERKASRIAREIEGEETHDIHLAEERGIDFDDGFDVDEEIRYSAVHRQIDGGIFEDDADPPSDTYNTETFGGSTVSESQTPHSNISREKFFDKAHTSSASSAMQMQAVSILKSDAVFWVRILLKDRMDVEAIYPVHTDKDKSTYGSSTNYQTSSSLSDNTNKSLNAGNESRFIDKTSEDQEEKESALNDHIDDTGKYDLGLVFADVKFSTDMKERSSSVIDPNPLSSNPAEDGSGHSSKPANSCKLPDCSELVSQCPSTSTSFTSELAISGSVSRGPSLSPSSSMGSLSSEKSTLNPNAKEFKLNPNAKSFTPSSSFRPPVAMPEGSIYYTGNLPAVPPMQSLPMGASWQRTREVRLLLMLATNKKVSLDPLLAKSEAHEAILQMGPSFAAPMYNPQAAQLQSPPYIHPGGPLVSEDL
ncbi:hypothetical protein AXF42_Ash001264 [Apostasia shenzhenica]|uniref:LsmAD domain-containing protein n=1 Tax=Apostasia shenzhenica TaxID=1088818 RepID=A0A2I0AUF1_9ASPA|nr:hypothetical protein AXF42_Ash001264 [Apostasia shenzhenica]